VLFEVEAVAPGATAGVENVCASWEQGEEGRVELTHIDVDSSMVEILGVLVVEINGYHLTSESRRMLVGRRPDSVSVEQIERRIVQSADELLALVFRVTGLVHQRFAEWMVTVDEKAVALVQAIEKRALRQARELAVVAAIAVIAGEHEVPDLVEVTNGGHEQQRMREEVIDIGETWSRGLDRDVGEAVEALAFLIAVERIARR
jgi:hypothetical protein